MSDNLIPTVVHDQAVAKKHSGLAWIIAALMMALLTAGLLWTRADVAGNERADAGQEQVITSLSRDSQLLREALSQKGVDPNTVAPAPEKRVDAIPPTPGAAGVSVIRTAILPGGQLQVFYSDHSSQVVGQVVGAGGKPGPGPSVAQVAAGVSGYLTVHPPARGPAGADSVVPGLNGTNGLDSVVPGPAPTDAQVAAGVAAFCGANGDCRGPAGATGADSTVAGPPPTDAQVAASVAAFCSANGDCRGPAGQPPLSWTSVDANGRSSTCVRDTPFDPTAPTYSCAPTP